MRTGMLALETVRQITIPSGSDFPLLIQPSVQGYELEAWLREHTQTVWNLVARHGALLFRGFRVGSAVHFERAVLALAPALQEEYGDLPRAVTSTRFVQDATPYPSRYAILFHHEASQTPNWPEHMWFYCETPAVAGGETPLVASDEIWQRLPS